MATAKRILLTIAAAILLLPTGCSSRKIPQKTNELVYGLAGVDAVQISYDEEAITFLESSTGDLIIQEYMTADESGYHAKTAEKNRTIYISEGGKPPGSMSFERYVLVYLPASYAGTLRVTGTSGTVDLSALTLQAPTLQIENTAGEIVFGSIRGKQAALSTTSGRIAGGSIQADNIDIVTTSGEVVCELLAGTVSYATTSGNLTVSAAVGSGHYEASNSGILDITYTGLTGDLILSGKNDDIMLTVPAGLAFSFEAQSKNGTVSTDFQERLEVEGEAVSGTVGASPAVSIKITTHDGNITVKR